MIGNRDVAFFALVALAATLLCGPAAALAEDGEATSGGAVAMIADRRDEAAADVVIAAVQAQLSDVSVALAVVWVDTLAPDLPAQIAAAEEVARRTAAVAVFWCDLARADRIYLYFAAPKGGRVLVRELAGSGAGGVAEALAVIVRASVEAVLAGGRVGEVVAPPPPLPAAPGPAPAADEVDREVPRLSVGVAYELDVLSVDAPTVHGAAIGLALRLGRRLSIAAGYVASAPIAAEAHGAFLELRRHPIWIGGRLDWAIGRARVGAGLAFQLDVATELVRATAPGVAAAGGGREVTPSLLPTLRLGFLVARRVELCLAVGADVALYRRRYVVASPDGPLALLETWPVRPRAAVGLEVALW